MIPVNKAVVARYTIGKAKFEILVDPELAAKAQTSLKKGKDVDMSELLATETVFEDSKKGKRASKQDLKRTFNTEDVFAAARMILKNGVVHTTAAQRSKKSHALWDKIVEVISANALDLKTNKTIPAHAIEDALHLSHFRLDNRKAEDQLPDAIKHVRKVLPIIFKEKTLQISNIAPGLAKKCLQVCKTLGSVQKETWSSEKNLSIVISVPAGLKDQLVDQVNDITRGKIDVQLLR
ncbi:MAG TPA: ribosome assembly factor SBDS [Candidatus Nanoarchaeia archaeon]|nr:ribosome assembly factor SBDS [Candidatus Nanoarchaeia archaeon]